MNTIENIEAAIGSDPDGWVFAAIKGGKGTVQMQKRQNYQGEIFCLGTLMILLQRRTDAPIEKIAADAARFARDHEDDPAMELMLEE